MALGDMGGRNRGQHASWDQRLPRIATSALHRGRFVAGSSNVVLEAPTNVTSFWLSWSNAMTTRNGPVGSTRLHPNWPPASSKMDSQPTNSAT